MAERILVADDDKDIVAIIAESLLDERYQVSCAYNGIQVLDLMRSQKIDLFILDIMMPEMDGLETLKAIKRETDSPVLILSARSRDIDKVIGLQVGADDYLAKPFSMDELMARVNAHLRRERKRERLDEVLHAGKLELHKPMYQATLDGKTLDLSTKEFQILCYLIENKGRVLTREQIYSHVWNDFCDGDPNTVTVHIKNLRSKLDGEAGPLKTIWGAGYKWEDQADV